MHAAGAVLRSSFENGVRRLVSRLARAVDSEGELFNPYREVLSELDRPRGAAVRRANLRAYLNTFRNARSVLVGEAAGFHGCRFSGLPFTGEDLLVGERALPWTAGLFEPLGNSDLRAKAPAAFEDPQDVARLARFAPR